MVQTLLVAALAGGLAAGPRDDGAAKVVRALGQKVAAPAGDVGKTPLADVLRHLGRAHDLTFIVNNTAFENPASLAEAKAALPATARPDKLTVGGFLDVYLRALPVPEGVTYIVRPDFIEITSAAKAEAEADTTAKLVNLLNNQPVSLGETDLQTAPFQDVMRELARRYDLTFVIDPTAFENPGVVGDARAANLAAARLEGLTFAQFLRVYLRALPVPEQPTYLVRSWGIEITSREKAVLESGLAEALELAGESEEPGAVVRAQARVRLPLVSVVAEDRPLADVLKELTRAYNLNLVVDRAARNQVGEAKVSARLLNVPADTALELLAEQAGLGVVRKGNTFRIGEGVGGAQ
ncbi:MAG: hypothetical protein K2X82_18840 [Gemmataceae bacterium]|nr:hypothetical protein [Gemmataceae bacterium]